MNRWLPVALVVASLARGDVLTPRQSGTPFLRTWEAADYNAAPGNQCIAQNPATGYIYVGNNSGLLEFDGVRWRLIAPPGRVPVKALAIDGRGRVWTANEDLICCLEPDARGQLRAVSAAGRLPPGERAFRGAFASLAADGGVYIAALQRLFFFPDDGQLARVWPVDVSSLPLRLWRGADGLELQLAGGTVWRLGSGGLERVPGRNQWVASILGAGPANALTAEAATLRPHGDEGPICAAVLADGRIAFGTATQGLVIRDRAGREVQRIDRTRGLPSNRIEDLCEDREGGVWLALRNGISRLQLDSPYALHGPLQGFEGSPTQLELYGGDLLVSGTEGLARRQPGGEFHFLENLIHVARDLVRIDGRLYITGRDLQVIQPDDRVAVLDARSYQGFVPLREAPGYFVRGSPNGLWIVRRDGATWRQVGRLTGLAGSASALLEEPAGVVWAVALDAGELSRVDFRGGLLLAAPVIRLGKDRGLPDGLNEYNSSLLRLGGGLDAVARGHLVRYVETAGRFEPETRIEGLHDDEPALGAPKQDRNEAASEPNRPALARMDDNGGLWLQLGGWSRRVFRVEPDGPGRWRARPINGPPLRYLNATVLLPDAARHTLWLGGLGKLVSQDLDWRPARPAPALLAAIRTVALADGTVVWGDGGGAPRSGQLELSPRERNLRFGFTAASFVADQSGRSHLAFRTRLDGLDGGWSPWTADTAREVTNLPFHAFTLRVQARDGEGRVSVPAAFAFSIAPPWWRAPWGLAGETLLAIALVAAVTRRFAALALQRRVRRLEAREAVQAERLRLARDMHDDLGSGLGRIALLGQNVLDRPGETAAAQANLQKIVEAARSLSRATRDIIWAVNPGSDTAPELAHHLAQLVEEKLGEAGIACACDVAPDLPAVTLGAGARHDVLLAVKESAHNLIKYSEAKRAEFSVHAERNALVVTLRDFGRGFAPGECRGSGLGIASIAARLASHGGSGTVRGEAGRGTTVRLTLPLPASE